jgi:hypothetical protein
MRECWGDSLKPFSSTPRRGHLEMAEDVLGGHLEKVRWDVINPKPPRMDLRYESV